MRYFTRDYFTVNETAGAINKNERAVMRLCRAGKFPGAVKEKGRWEIPIAGVYEYINPQEAAKAKAEVKRLLNEYGKGAVLLAQLKAKIINRYFTLYGRFRGEGFGQKHAQTLAVEQCKLDLSRGREEIGRFSRTTLFRWKQKLHKEGLEGLIDKRRPPSKRR